MELLKGKTTHKAPNPEKGNLSTVPPTILIQHQRVTLSADIIFVKRIPFLITQSRVIKMRTIENRLPTKCEMAMKAMRNVINLYKKEDLLWRDY